MKNILSALIAGVFMITVAGAASAMEHAAAPAKEPTEIEKACKKEFEKDMKKYEECVKAKEAAAKAAAPAAEAPAAPAAK